MNGLIGALIITTALSGATPAALPEDTSNYIPHIESNGTLAFGPTEEERLAEQKRLEEEAAAAEAERQRLEEEAKKNPENLDYKYTISTYSTKYSQNAGNANRNFNMELACKAIDGTILAPGQEFSYNDTLLSKRNPKNDYKPAGVFSGGRVTTGIGGGICQVSTTLFDAALYSKMTITQRRCHSMRVGYVPAGMDATVSWGSVDFRFRNDLTQPVKIQASAYNGVITVSFLSPENPYIGNIDVKVFNDHGVYTLYRYVNGVAEYSTKSSYK